MAYATPFCYTQVSETLSDVAHSVLTHGFASYCLDDGASQILAKAIEEALDFFRLDEKSKVQFQKIVKGHLHGYNVPSRAKELYRAFLFENGSPDVQPWPNEGLKDASLKLAKTLHLLLCLTLEAIRNEAERSQERSTSEHHGLKRMEQPEKEAALLPSVGCPLDYFFYNGAAPSVVNCSAHVDRGVLICVCLDNRIPGLEVLPREQDSFLCPEEIVKRALTKSGRFVCIMAGDQLKELVTCRNGMEDCTRACVHQVRQRLEGKRLSVTYELRV